MKKRLFDLVTDGDIHELNKRRIELLDNLDQKGELGYSLVGMAVAKCNKDTLNLLLSLGADLNSKDLKGRTPLHYAAEYNYYEMAKVLIEVGADVSVVNIWGNTPLWVAVFNVKGNLSKHPLVRLLIDSGADPQHKNNTGMSPLQFAEQVGDHELIRILT